MGYCKSRLTHRAVRAPVEPIKSVDAQAGKGRLMLRSLVTLPVTILLLASASNTATAARVCIIFTTAEADFTTTESTRKQVPCGPGERSRQNHVGQGLPRICIRT